MSLYVEALIVGLILCIMLVLVSLVIKLDSTLMVAVIGFTTGALTHLLFEYSGANAWYCKNGNACKN